MEAKFCPQCGTPRAGNFCGKCGHSFIANQQQGTVGNSAAASELQNETSIKMLPKGLVRGEDFDPKKQCGNCGLKLGKGSVCKECGE